MEWSNRYIGFPTRWGTSSTGNVGIGCCHYFYSVEGNTLSIYSQSGERCHSQAVVANAWHHRSDALSSIGTAAGIGGAILLGPHWAVLDPIAAVTVSFFIMRVSIRLLVPCLDELLEKSLPDSVEREIEGIVLSFGGVSEPHHLRTRRIGNNYAIEIHIRMDGNISLHKAHETATGIEHRLKEKFGEDTHVGIHVEPVK